MITDTPGPLVGRLSAWFGWRQRTIPASHMALLQALAIGLLAGTASVLFRWGMGGLGTWRNHLGLQPEHWSEWLILPLIGLLGGAVAGHLTVYLAPDAKGSGIPQVKLALADAARPIRLRTIGVKFAGAVIGIGSGLSMGREGPTVQIGGGIGEWVNRWHPGTLQHRRSMIAAGAGSGVAAAFNAPIAGFIFIVEELLQDWSTTTMATAVLATVTAAIVARVLGGNIYMYQLPLTSFHLAEIPFYLGLGLLAGLTGLAFIRSVLFALRLFARIPALPPAWYPAIAGCLTGCIGLLLPAAIGGSHDLAEMAFHGELALGALAVAFLAKFVLTVVAYGSGAPGGVFAPTLVLGACLGAGIGTVTQALVGGGSATVAGFAFVGMGALFTAVARAPVTAILIVFELTGNYEQVLPLMLACGIAHLTAHALGGVSIYDALLEQAGIALQPFAPESPDRRTVRTVMTAPAETLDAGTTVGALQDRLQRSPHQGFPVCEAGRPVGMITAADLRRARAAGLSADDCLAQVISRPLVTIAPDDLIRDALDLMAAKHIGRLVVVDPDHPGEIAGILTRSDVLRGCSTGPAAVQRPG